MLFLPNADKIAQMPKFHLIPLRYRTNYIKALDVSIMIIAKSRSDVKALVLNVWGYEFRPNCVSFCMAPYFGREATSRTGPRSRQTAKERNHERCYISEW